MGIILFEALVVWTLSSLLVGESGPYGLFEKIRSELGVLHPAEVDVETLGEWSHAHGDKEAPECFSFNLAGEILCCFWCTSMWVSVVVTLVCAIFLELPWWMWVFSPFAVRTVAIMIDEYINGTQQQ